MSITTEILRPRLSAVLDRRYDLRVIALQAGAGFGKSTLLRQAYASGLVHPRGIDLVHQCGPDDANLSVLGGRLRSMIGLTDSPRADIDGEAAALSGALGLRAPVDVAVLIDDVHLLADGSAGAQLLAALFARLPANAHLVLFSRRNVPVPMAREVANGTGVLLKEDDLAFSHEEWAKATVAEVSSAGEYVPWPALAGSPCAPGRGED